MRGVWVHLDNLVHEVSRDSDAIQDCLKVSFLLPPTRTGGQIQTDKTRMQWLTKVTGRLACVAGFCSKIIRVSGDERPVIFDDRFHQPMVFPAGHAAARHMRTLRVTGHRGHFGQRDGQALINQKLQ